MSETPRVRFRNMHNAVVREMSNVTVPFADLRAQYLSIKEDIDAAIAKVIDKSAFIRGPYVETFEREFASLLGISHCVSCGNGTDALYIAMRALGVKPGDQVITAAHSWISSSESITQAGGQVVFCDTDTETYTIDPSRLEALITTDTVGIIPVHLYGQPADMGAIMRIAQKHDLWVIEDCAQAHLARYKGRLVGTFGDAATFSFYPGKNLGAMGDAGAIVTANDDLAERSAMLARHGGLVKGDHRVEGFNSRMDGLQAAILSVKLRHLSAWTESRQRLANVYTEKLALVEELVTPVVATGREHVYHLYVVRHPRRDELADHLKRAGIQTAVNYPVALPFLPAYSRLAHTPDEFPNAWSHQSRILSLPVFPEMTEMQMDTVVNSINGFQ